MKNLPDFLKLMLSSPPSAGAGVHNWLFCTARQLHAHLPAGQIVALLESRVAGCGRAVPLTEIVAAVQNSLPCAWTPNTKAAKGKTSAPSLPKSKWPTVNQIARADIIRNGFDLAKLVGLSKVSVESNAPQTEAIIDQLFPDNLLLCCGEANYSFDTKPREEWRGQLSALALIVPSPMSAATGLTKSGKESKHTLNNTGARRFLICEFDSGTADEHAALLIHLATYAPLVCAVHSGGKSLHGWFYVHGQPDAKIEKFFRYAVSLGADPATWTRCQFVRMPDGIRDNGKRQSVHYINFNPMKTI